MSSSSFLYVTGSKGKGASASDLLLLLNSSLGHRVPAAGRYISTSARTRTRSPSKSTMCSISSKKVRRQKREESRRGNRNQNKEVFRLMRWIWNGLWCFSFSPQTRQAGGRAELEGRKVCSRGTMWKRFDEDLDRLLQTCLCMFISRFQSYGHLVKSAQKLPVSCWWFHGKSGICAIQTEQVVNYSWVHY